MQLVELKVLFEVNILFFPISAKGFENATDSSFRALSNQKIASSRLAACRRCADAARASKYCSEQGAKKEHSLSYVTDEQRSAE